MCMKLFLFLFLATTVTLAQGVSNFYDERMGISLSYPEEWKFRLDSEDFLEMGSADFDGNTVLIFTHSSNPEIEEVLKIGINENNKAYSSDSLIKYVVSPLNFKADTTIIGGREFLKAYKDFGPIKVTYYINSHRKMFSYVMGMVFNEDQILQHKIENVISSIKFLSSHQDNK